MRHTKTIAEPSPFWTIRIRKPVLSRATVRWAAALALSVGFNVGFISEALAASESDCQASAELHYAISGESDAAYEDALAACHAGALFTDYVGTTQAGIDAYHDCTESESFADAYEAAGECDTETSWAEAVEGSDCEWRPVCGDADGNEVGAP